MKDHALHVDAEGFELRGARLFRDGKQWRWGRPSRIRWDELRDIDAELRKARVSDVLGSVLNLASWDSDSVDVNPRGYVRFVFTLATGDEVYTDIPRSLMWKPDQRWVDEFLAGARLAIEDPTTRESFQR